MKKILFLSAFIVSICTFAQKNYNMVGFEQQLLPLTDRMFYSETDNERFAANERFIEDMEDALLYENSFSYPFEKLDKINILTSDDKKFRIITWAIVNQQGDYENYGFVQSKNEAVGGYDVYRLFDKSEEIFSPEYEKLNDSLWFGAVYYDIITTKHAGKTYYTLLGWDGNDIYTRRKVIEPISFKGNGSKPVFGQNIFYKDKTRMRYIFEYSTETSFTLAYGQQYYETEGQKKAKSTLLHKAKPFEVEPPKTTKKMLIFFDELEPLRTSMDGMFQYYVPSGNMSGMYFEDGKWKKLRFNVLPRNKADKRDAYQPEKTVRGGLFP